MTTLSPETVGGFFLTLFRLHEEKKNSAITYGVCPWIFSLISHSFKPEVQLIVFLSVMQPQGWGFGFFCITIFGTPRPGFYFLS